MRIQTTMIREGGSHVQIDNVNYHFAPQPDGRHIADVTNGAHIKRFLAIEGYDILDEELNKGDGTADTKKAKTAKAPALPPESNDDPAANPTGAEVVEDLVTGSEEDAITVALIDEEGNGDTGQAPPQEVSDAELDALFTKHVGRAPHPQMKPETKRAKIEEAIQEAAKSNAGA